MAQVFPHFLELSQFWTCCCCSQSTLPVFEVCNSGLMALDLLLQGLSQPQKIH
ncbi:hypothetical protein I79_018395 [Cricetulus griseus]|uniref:Uncharacterized protein n=1 Tax=Cricetulus griseus TaxID=10029 RepID=G3I4L4_CRIGR|nr:hypothetical protein I79_018395 [Cricetulus griseus]